MRKVTTVPFVYTEAISVSILKKQADVTSSGGGGGLLPNMGYIGMCHCEGYGFQAVFKQFTLR